MRKIKNISKFELFKRKLYKYIDNNYTQSIILICALFALFSLDFLRLFFPKSFDAPFAIILDVLFFLFSLEIILTCVACNSYLGSFYFYLDILEVLSLIPEVDFIWYQIEHIIHQNTLYL